MRYNLSEIAHAVWLPISSGLLTAGVTWLVWFFSTAHCTPANAAVLMCEVTPLGRYLTSAALRDCIIHAGIVMTLTGGSDVMLFLRERRHSAALAEQLKISEEGRQRAEEAHQRAEQRNEEALQRSEEARQLAEQRLTEQHQAMMEQHQAMMEQHQAMMVLTAKLSDATDRDRNGHTPPQS